MSYQPYNSRYDLNNAIKTFLFKVKVIQLNGFYSSLLEERNYASAYYVSCIKNLKITTKFFCVLRSSKKVSSEESVRKQNLKIKI